MDRFFIARICISLCLCVSLNAQEPFNVNQTAEVTFKKTAKNKQKHTREDFQIRKNKMIREQEFIESVEEELIRIGQLERPQDKIRASLLLIRLIVQSKVIRKKVRLALFEIVERFLKNILGKGEVGMKRGEVESFMHKAAQQTHDAVNMESIINVNATSEEIQVVLESISKIKKNLMKSSENGEEPLSWGYLIGIPVGVSVAVTLLLAWIFGHKENFRGNLQPGSAFTKEQFSEIYNILSQLKDTNIRLTKAPLPPNSPMHSLHGHTNNPQP